MSRTILKISNLEKTYPHQNKNALADFSLSVREGEKIGLVGANGSGKTTLFRIILNMIPADRGEIEILGQKNLESAKRDIGFVPEHQQGLENYTARELIYFAGRMSGMSKSLIKKRGDELLQWVDLEKEADKLISSFSKGMLQRAHLATALVNSPKLLLLDEPMSGLDPSGQRSLKTLLENLGNYTYLFTSHNLSDIETLCDRALILSEGRLMADVKLGGNQREIFYFEGPPQLEELLGKMDGIELKQKKAGKEIFSAEFIASNDVFQRFLSAASGAGLSLHKIRTRGILEDLYLKYVKG